MDKEKKKIFEIIVYDNMTGDIIYNGRKLSVNYITFKWEINQIPEIKLGLVPMPIKEDNNNE